MKWWIFAGGQPTESPLWGALALTIAGRLSIDLLVFGIDWWVGGGEYARVWLDMV